MTVPFDTLGAIAALGAEGGPDDDPKRRHPYESNLEKDRAYRAAQPRPMINGVAPSPYDWDVQVPRDYDIASRAATGKMQGSPVYDPTSPIYGSPDALAARQRHAALVKQFGFDQPAYMNEIPQTLASPLTNALVNGPTGNDPIRDALVWQVQNPTARNQGGTVVYGGFDDAVPRAEEAAIRQQGYLRNLTGYDATRSGIGLQGAQARAQDAEATIGIPAQSEAANVNAQAQADLARVAGQKQALEEKVVGNSLKPPVGTPTLESFLPIIQKGKYPSDVLSKLDTGGAFDDPRLAASVLAAFRAQHGQEIDRIMAGGTEGNVASILPTSGNLLSGYGLWGNPATSGGMAYGRSLQRFRERIAQLFPNAYRQVVPPPRP